MILARYTLKRGSEVLADKDVALPESSRLAMMFEDLDRVEAIAMKVSDGTVMTCTRIQEEETPDAQKHQD